MIAFDRDLIELQSFYLSNPQITPIHCFLVYLPIVLAHCNPGLHHVVILLSIVNDVHWIHGRREHRMSPFLAVFATQNQSRLE